MPLKNLDKYIKDKVQGYKPAYQEDLWKGIEEKLPTARVPNGRGSWMWPVAAIVAIATLAPFTIKFYNLTNRNQEIAQKNTETSKSLSNKGNIGISSSNAAITSSSSQDNLNHVQDLQTANSFKKATKSFALSGSSKNTGSSNGPDNQSMNANNESPQQNESSIASTANQEIAVNKPVQGQAMSNIYPGNSLAGGSSNQEINNASDTRYPDRKNRHPLNDDKWNNWQSIFYPFWDNPAYTGSEGKVNITVDNRTDNSINSQSTQSQSTYTNMGAEYYNSALGLGVGAFRLSELSLYSLQNTYGVALSKSVLQIGSTTVKAGVSGIKIDNNLFFPLLNYSDQINPKFGFINATSEKSISGTTYAYGLNGGLWVSNPHVMAGLDVTDLNQPKLGFGSDAAALPRQWRGMFGYRFALGPDFQFMPMAIVTRENKVNQANAMFTAVYKDIYTLSLAYENVDPTSGLGNAYVYGAVNVAKRFRVFASYGKDLELALGETDINETFIHLGVKYQVIR